MSLPKYDGNFDIAFPCGPRLFEPPFPGSNEKYVFRQPWMVRKSKYKPATIGSKTADGYILCEESPYQDEGGGDIVSFERTYARVPKARREWEPFIVTGQQLTTTSITEFTYKARTMLVHEYFHAPNGQENRIVEYGPTIAVMIAGVVQILEGEPYRKVSGYEIVEDSVLERWLGPIFCRTVRLVKSRSLQLYTG